MIFHKHEDESPHDFNASQQLVLVCLSKAYEVVRECRYIVFNLSSNSATSVFQRVTCLCVGHPSDKSPCQVYLAEAL